MPTASTRHAPQPSAAPRILLCATLRWPIAARLAMAFAELGGRVEVLCPRGHPVTRTRAATRIHRHSASRPLRSLEEALQSAEPDLIIPCDDDAALQLQRLHAQVDAADRPSPALRELIARSLGAPEACLLATTRGRLMALAASLGIRVPNTRTVLTPQELVAWLDGHALPAVIKIDGSWGGQGVAIVRSREEARRAFERLAAPPSPAQALARTLLDRDSLPLRRRLAASRSVLTVQDFIAGEPANRAVACWRGEVLAGTSVQALRTQQSTGPATVVRVIDNAEMDEAVRRLVQGLGLSGLWGVDFMLEASTGAAHLIEMNPRATPISHLVPQPGHDLPAALLSALGAWPAAAGRAAIGHEVIALFPGECRRDPASLHLRMDHHDVPWNEPDLVRDGLEAPWAERGWIARAWARWREPARNTPPRRDTAPDAYGSEQTLPACADYNPLSRHTP
ncbi:ATP-grasp domain-containing protein [uncultured Piscinibacter sp.]|uniref:ATP-grasp domain-containing protein n=1 Tax=uncultured Piscinibacter sp. TaxID=1131835 RepID=UPI00260BDC29|nr:ATP-grasp domain-containing protein [uncultured Piscinibacter sp.]